MLKKICIKCNKELDLSYFNKHCHCKDGYRNICKDCAKKYRKQHIVKERENARKRYSENREFL